jgi:LacI family transcriptional regulator
VIVDDFDSALNSTQRLIDLGCKTLLCCLHVDNLSVGKLRVEELFKSFK